MTVYIVDHPEARRRIEAVCKPNDEIFGPMMPKGCTGCFGCWVKTPGHCVIDDEAGELAVSLARHSRVVVVSRLVYGGYSPVVKTYFDRSVGYMHAKFAVVGGEMHHRQRYEHSFSLEVHFYGEDETLFPLARRMVERQAINFFAGTVNTEFYRIEEAGA